ncbi:MAG: hypothetical protein II903_09275 [Spirochaetales bacterium]|nr:hypothetical protein [Spirochaetales bacterium]
MANDLQVLEPWNYEKSVETTKALVSTFRKVSLDLARELYIARQALEPRGRTASGTFVPMVKSWEQYCNDIGLIKRTADRWLALYIPEEDRLLTVEEAKDLLEQRYQELRKLVVEHIGDSSWRPEGWIKAFETRYQKELRAAELERIAMADEFDNYIDEGGQIWLFDQPYLETLAERIGSYNADPRTYMRLCTTYEKDACRDVDIRKQVSVFQLTKAALEDISEAARPEVTRFVAELLLKDAAGVLEVYNA